MSSSVYIRHVSYSHPGYSLLDHPIPSSSSIQPSPSVSKPYSGLRSSERDCLRDSDSFILTLVQDTNKIFLYYKEYSLFVFMFVCLFVWMFGPQILVGELSRTTGMLLTGLTFIGILQAKLGS